MLFGVNLTHFEAKYDNTVHVEYDSCQAVLFLNLVSSFAIFRVSRVKSEQRNKSDGIAAEQTKSLSSYLRCCQLKA